MSRYLGPWRKSGGLFWRTICVTGWDEWAFRALAVLGGAAEGLLIGAFIGLVLTALGVGVTAEAPPVAGLVGMLGASATVIAAEIGAVLGGLAGAILAYAAHCSPCGSCIEIAFRQVLGKMIPALPFLVLARTVDCTLVPPGCP